MRKFALALLVGATLSLQSCGKVAEKVFEQVVEAAEKQQEESSSPDIKPIKVDGVKFRCVELLYDDKKDACEEAFILTYVDKNTLVITVLADNENDELKRVRGNVFADSKGNEANVDITGDIITLSMIYKESVIISSFVRK